MKRCPQCHRVETDEALKFCRVDGATLVSDSGSVSGEAGAIVPELDGLRAEPRFKGMLKRMNLPE